MATGIGLEGNKSTTSALAVDPLRCNVLKNRRSSSLLVSSVRCATMISCMDRVPSRSRVPIPCRADLSLNWSPLLCSWSMLPLRNQFHLDWILNYKQIRHIRGATHKEIPGSQLVLKFSHILQAWIMEIFKLLTTLKCHLQIVILASKPDLKFH
jgi:hypothetical protein